VKLLVVDDEPLARERMRRMVAEFPGHEVVAEAGDGESALRVVRDQAVDVVLLDLHMPGLDGLQVARLLADMDIPPAVIVITAHSEHALSAHNIQAAGYLLKPVRRDDLAAALKRARRPSRAQIATLAGLDIETTPGFISARTRDGVERVAVADILYFWADQKYTSAYHLGGELLMEQSLLTLAEQLGSSFLRVHRKALVARRHIIGLKTESEDGPLLTLRYCREQVPVSRRRLAEVRAVITD